MENRRKHQRLERRFPAVFHPEMEPNLPVQGITENVSQRGAFIKTESWRSFKAQERVLLVFFLPPEFTGQNEPIGLRGEAVISRVDQDNKRVAVEFIKNYRQFDPVNPV